MLVVLGGFWAAMTLLLWRFEFTASPQARTPVDPSLVWQRILTSLDSSSLAITHRDNRIGYCHLIPSVADRVTHSGPTNAPEGRVRSIGGYILDLSGSVGTPETEIRIRFDGRVTFARNQEWEAFRIQINARPLLVTVTATNHTGLVCLKMESPELATERVLRWSDFNQPESLLAQLLGPAAPLAINALPFELPDIRLLDTSRQMQWTTTTDRLTIGNSTSLVYRLDLQALEGYSVVILVSRAGEILRVDLPEHVTLINEAITGL
ncbi:MAG: hypothetical protein MUE94_08745 [Verrucomicrobia bacterium]|jgi:hypothetical protein|nr:hypothetical protein [Verrucomicrobiota bacterium]